MGFWEFFRSYNFKGKLKSLQNHAKIEKGNFITSDINCTKQFIFQTCDFGNFSGAITLRES